MRLLCLGDSLTYGYDVPPAQQWTAIVAQKLRITIQNEGICGDTTAGILYRCGMLDLTGYDAFFLMGGVNDIFLEMPLAQAKENLVRTAAMMAQLHKPVCIGIPPLTKPESAIFGWQRSEDVTRHNRCIRELNQYMVALCRREGYYPIDFAKAMDTAEAAGESALYADGVHPSAKGYAVFAALACDVLEAIMK